MLKQLFTKIILGFTALTIIIGSFFILSLKHRDTLKYAAPQNATVYLHLESANQLATLSKNHKLLLNNLIQLTDKNFNVFGVAEIIGNSELAMFKTNKQPFILAAHSTPRLTAYLDGYGVGYSGEKIIYFPTNQNTIKGPLGLTAKQPLLDFSDINLYLSGDEPLIFCNINTANIETGHLFAQIAISSTKETLSIKTSLPLPKTNEGSLIMTAGLPADTEIYLTNADLFGAPLTANLIKDHFDYILLQKISRPLEYLRTSSASLFNFGKNYSKDQILDMVKFTLATLTPRKENHALPDGTEATNLVVDPTRWSFERLPGDAESYQLFDGTLELSLYLTKEVDNWVLTKNSEMKELLAKSDNVQWLGSCLPENLPVSQINIAPHASLITIGFYQGNSGHMNICLH